MDVVLYTGLSGPVPHRGGDLPDVSAERTTQTSGEQQSIELKYVNRPKILMLKFSPDSQNLYLPFSIMAWMLLQMYIEFA